MTLLRTWGPRALFLIVLLAHAAVCGWAFLQPDTVGPRPTLETP